MQPTSLQLKSVIIRLLCIAFRSEPFCLLRRRRCSRRRGLCFSLLPPHLCIVQLLYTTSVEHTSLQTDPDKHISLRDCLYPPIRRRQLFAMVFILFPLIRSRCVCCTLVLSSVFAHAFSLALALFLFSRLPSNTCVCCKCANVPTHRAVLIFKLALCPPVSGSCYASRLFSSRLDLSIWIDFLNLKLPVPQRGKSKHVKHFAQRCSLLYSFFLARRSCYLFVCFYHWCSSSSSSNCCLTYTATASVIYRFFFDQTSFFSLCAASSISDQHDHSWASCRVQSIAREWPNELSRTNNCPLNGPLPFTTDRQTHTVRQTEIAKKEDPPIEGFIQSIECALCVRLQSAATAADQFVCLIRQIASERAFIVFLSALFALLLTQSNTHWHQPACTDWAQSGQHHHHHRCSSVRFFFTVILSLFFFISPLLVVSVCSAN